ncbi:hypothetical protein M1403_00340 [Patescibacteria group bacterium]|nr:hypothetical protein [Patescibacteria group bacterium]
MGQETRDKLAKTGVIAGVATGMAIGGAAVVHSLPAQELEAKTVNVTVFGAYVPLPGNKPEDLAHLYGGKKIQDLTHRTEIMMLNSNDPAGSFPGSVLVREIGSQQWYRTSLSETKDPTPGIKGEAIGFFKDGVALGKDIYVMGVYPSFNTGFGIWSSVDGGVHWEQRTVLDGNKPMPDHLAFVKAAQSLQNLSSKK